MSGPAGAEGIRAGDRVIIDGRPQVVLSASGTAIRFARDDGVIEEAAVAGLAGSGRLQLGRTGGRPVPQAGLAGLPPELVERGKPASASYRPHPERPGQTRRQTPHHLGDLDHRDRRARLRRLIRGDQGLHPEPQPSCLSE
jgi:hypothetical protein